MQINLNMGEFKQGFCGCFDNCGLCIFTYFCPCIVWGQTAEKVLSWFWVIQSYFTCRLPSRVSMSSANFVDARNYRVEYFKRDALAMRSCMYVHAGWWELLLVWVLPVGAHWRLCIRRPDQRESAGAAWHRGNIPITLSYCRPAFVVSSHINRITIQNFRICAYNFRKARYTDTQVQKCIITKGVVTVTYKVT